MHLRTWTVASAAVVTLVILALISSADEPPEIRIPKNIQDAVNKMADDIAKGNEVDKDADAFFKDHKGDLKKMMWLFRPRGKDGLGGLGFGPKPGTYVLDGIELVIVTQSGKQPRMTLNVKTAAADLNRLADVTLAMAEITGKYVPEKKGGEKLAKVWNTANDEMKQAALALKRAVKAENNADVKKAFVSLAASCKKCHTAFRDDGEPEAPVLVPQQTRQALSAMADAVGKGEKIDKAADAFFNEHKSDLKTTKLLFKQRGKDEKGGFGVGPKAGVYMPDEIEGYIALYGSRRDVPVTKAQLKTDGEDLNRLADVTIAMAEVMQRYKPKNIIIGGPEILTPAQWAGEADAMKQGAIDLKAAVNANNSDDAKKAFTKMYSSCVSCHQLFRPGGAVPPMR